MNPENSITYPGVHKSFKLQRFNEDEQKVLKKIKSEWYLTNSGSRIRIATSEYEYFLMKPTNSYSEMFNISREIVTVFSSYSVFEPRTLDAFDEAQRSVPELRVETVCRVLISNDSDIENKIESLLKTDPEQPIVIPFTYKELRNPYDDYFIRNRFRKHFYSRDLFSFLSPLKKDLYFFGRSELIQQIVNRHRSGEHTGLFGLRKSGKTSIIYAIERHLAANSELYISLDCENPSIHKLHWNELLLKLVVLYKALIDSKYKVVQENRYDEKYAADSFCNDILGIFNSKKHKRFLILMDEIERISPLTGSSLHWKERDDFIFFWQTLRGFYQRNPDVFTYMIVGTNPACIESPTILSHENPLFCSIQNYYVPSFTIEQVRQMVRKLGKYMGLHFDEILYGKLSEDFGGHPFIIRQLCSDIHKHCLGERPIKVDRPLYEKIKSSFQVVSVDYFDMILHVLRDWYPEEYDMLRFLAIGDIKSFTQFATDNVKYTRHLIGYGLVTQSENGYTFSIESMKDYINNIHKFERKNLTPEDKIAEVSLRRNKIEKALRVLIHNSLLTVYGQKKTRTAILKSLPESRREKISNLDIDEIIGKDKSSLFFLELIQIIIHEWNIFQNVFCIELDKLKYILSEINDIGRADCHAKLLDEQEFQQLRYYFSKMESILEKMNYL